jgi:hypothetical protein
MGKFGYAFGIIAFLCAGIGFAMIGYIFAWTEAAIRFGNCVQP